MSYYVIGVHDNPAEGEEEFDVRYALAHSPLFSEVPWTVEPLHVHMETTGVVRQIDQLQARVDRLVEQVTALRLRKAELDERLDQIRRLAAGQVPTPSTPGHTGDPDRDRLERYTENQLAATAGGWDPVRQTTAGPTAQDAASQALTAREG